MKKRIGEHNYEALSKKFAELQADFRELQRENHELQINVEALQAASAYGVGENGGWEYRLIYINYSELLQAINRTPTARDFQMHTEMLVNQMAREGWTVVGTPGTATTWMRRRVQ